MVTKEKCKCFNNATHIIFDLDGTLLDTEMIYEKLYSDLVKIYDRVIPTSLTFKYQGAPAEFAIKILIQELELPVSFNELFSKYKELSALQFASLELMKGAERLIKHFHHHQIPMAIATSSDPVSAKLKTSNFPQLFKLIHHVVTSGDVLNGKPAPDIFLLAAKKFPDRPKPECCLVFEDAVNGVKGARAANMQVVMTPDKRVPEEQRDEASLVLESLEVFQPELFGLPPFEKKKK